MQIDPRHEFLNLHLSYHQPTFCQADVVIPAPLVDAFYKQAIISQKESMPTFGFHKSGAPLAYVEHNFKVHILHHLKEFMFKFLVLNYLYKEIRLKKIIVAGDPRLTDIIIEPGQDAHFKFDLSLFPSISLQEWKYLPFKAPKRKNYKDLDRQVETFLHEEIVCQENYQQPKAQVGDWINFTLTLISDTNNHLLHEVKTNIWLRIGEEEPDKPFQELFLHKRVGDYFTSTASCLQDYLSEQIATQYTFGIEVVDIVPYAYFCVDQFKNHFKLKTNKEMYQKMIEVFSYRNDLSQRRTMVEESLKLLLSRHKFDIPNHMVLRQQKIVLDTIQCNPDYHVYRIQKDFKDSIRELAEKQACEQLFIDQLAYEEDIHITHTDLKSYLNFTKRPRMKEFLYFEPPITKHGGQELPITTEELTRTCLREKTINHIIYHLTRK